MALFVSGDRAPTERPAARAQGRLVMAWHKDEDLPTAVMNEGTAGRAATAPGGPSRLARRFRQDEVSQWSQNPDASKVRNGTDRKGQRGKGLKQG